VTDKPQLAPFNHFDSGDPLILRINGKAEVVVQDAVAYS
jgi:hypothetical protein